MEFYSDKIQSEIRKAVHDEIKSKVKAFYSAVDIADMMGIGIANARQLMRSESFPLIECGAEGGRNPRLRVEAVAFWRWCRSKRNHTGINYRGGDVR